MTSTTGLAGGETIDITNANVAHSGEQTVAYSGIENLVVNGTLGDDTFNVTTTPSGTTTLDGLAVEIPTTSLKAHWGAHW